MTNKFIIDLRNTSTTLDICIPGVLDDMTKLVDETGHSVWHCSICGYKSKQITNVKRHIVRKHGENQHLPCPLCKKPFKNKYNFNNHLNANHPEMYDKYRYVVSHAR